MSYIYLDRDVTYLLGLLVARGQLYRKLGVSRLSIELPSRVLYPRKARAQYEADIRRAVSAARERVGELLEPDVRVRKYMGGFRFSVAYRGYPLSLRALTLLLGMKDSTQPSIPRQIFGAEATIRREFIRGFADASCNPFLAKQNDNGRYTVNLQVQWKNKNLTAQLIELLKGLGTQVNRTTAGTGSHPGEGRERQIPVPVEAFRPLGFFFPYKQRQLDQLVASQ